MILADSFGRKFHYLRLSVEDACDYRCRYCLPGGYKKEEPEPPLSVDEIRRLTGAFADMGFWKVRLTGGEPLLRSDLPALIAEVHTALARVMDGSAAPAIEAQKQKWSPAQLRQHLAEFTATQSPAAADADSLLDVG